MGFEGADVEALRDLAQEFDTGAGKLDALRTALGPASPAGAWAGRDGDEFRHAWSSRLGPSLHSVADSLRHGARQLRSNADAQARTSAELHGGDAFAGARATGSGQVGDSTSGGTTFGRDDGADGGYQAEGEYSKTGADGSKTTVSGSISHDPDAGTTTGSGSFSKGHEFELPGKGTLFVGLVGAASLTKGASSAGGFTTYTTSSDVSGGAEGSIGAKGVGVSGSYVRGATSDYELKVPTGTDPTSVDPRNPASMPVGSSVRVQGGTYVDQGAEVTYRGAAVEGDTKSSQGTSTMVEKVGANTVRISAGPTQGLEQYTALGMDLDDAKVKVMFGTDNTMDYGSYHSADLDLSTEAGQAAYQQYLQDGDFPAQAADGVSGTTDVTKLDVSSDTGVKVDVPGWNHNVQLAHSSGHVVEVTKPDGTGSTHYSFDGTGPGQSEIAIPHDADGKAIAADSQYTYRFTAEDATAPLLNTANVSGLHADTTVSAGDTVSVHLTQAQMTTLLNNAHHADAGSPYSGLSTYTNDNAPPGTQALPKMDATALGFKLASLPRGSNEFAMLLTQIDQGADGDVLNGPSAFPGTITVDR